MNKINNIGLSRELTSCYDFQGFTEQEVWSRIAQKINIIIEHFNYLDTKIENEKANNKAKFEYLLGEGLNESVSKIIIQKISDGTIGELINGTLLKEINDKVDDFQQTFNEQLADNTKKLETIRKFNIATHPLFDENDIGVAFNKIMKTIKEGDYIYLEYDKEVKCVTPMVVPAWSNELQIDFRCMINFIGKGTMFTTETGCQRCQFNFTRINGLNNTNNGMEFICLHHSNVKCLSFDNFNKDITVSGGNNMGSQYNRFDCQFIKGVTCITLDAKHKLGWVSENIFTGRVLGSQGIVFMPITDVEEDYKYLKYENNHFENMGFEGLTMYASYLRNASGTTFSNYRLFKEENTEVTNCEFFYEDSNTCKNSIYSTSCYQLINYYNGVNSEGTKIIGSIMYGSTKKQGDICQIIGGKKYWINEAMFKKIALSSGTKTVDLTSSQQLFIMDKIYDCLFIQTKGPNRTLAIPEYMLEDGFTFNLDLQFVSGSTTGDDLNIKINNASGKILCTIPQSQGNGTYKLMYWKSDGVYSNRMRWKRENQVLFV